MIELHLDHPSLENNPNTILTDKALAQSTTFKVANNQGFSANDFIVIGTPGSEKTEICQISSLSGNDTINLASALKFDHYVNTIITLTYYDQINIYRADVKEGPYTLIATVNIQIDEEFTVYRDTEGDIEKYYTLEYKNSYTNAISARSAPLSGIGFTENSVRILLERAKRLFSRYSERIIEKDLWLEFLNEAYREVINRIRPLNLDYGLKRTTISLKANERYYNLPSDFLNLKAVYVDYGAKPKPAKQLDLGVYEPSAEDFSQEYPYYHFEGTQLVIDPTPKEDKGQIILYYYYLPPKLIYDDDIIDPAYIIPSQAGILIDFVLARSLELDKRYEEANWYLQKFENRVALLEREYEERYKERTQFMPRWDAGFDTSHPFF